MCRKNERHGGPGSGGKESRVGPSKIESRRGEGEKGGREICQ